MPAGRVNEWIDRIGRFPQRNDNEWIDRIGRPDELLSARTLELTD